VGRTEVARSYTRRLKPACERTMNEISLAVERGEEAIVKGWDCIGEIEGIDKNTCCPGLQDRNGGFRMVILVARPGRAVRCPLHDSTPVLFP
jgi:hypothetical protein